jgi:multiple sugar transport system permease protein
MSALARPGARVGGVEVSPAWVMRRRWSYAGLLYALLIFFALIFMGPLLMAALSSLKVDPLEYPPRVYFEELRPRNWAAAWSLGTQGSGNPWTGGLNPGNSLSYSATYLVPTSVLEANATPAPLSVLIPRLRPGAGALALGNFVYASDYAQVTDLKVASVGEGQMPDGKPAQRVRYEWKITYPADAKNVDDASKPAPMIERTPMTLEAERGYVFAESTLDPSRRENMQAATAEFPYSYPKIQSFINAAPGFGNYLFRNYFRIFDEARSQTTGRPLFAQWIINSFLLVLLNTVSTLIFASMAGYAMARLDFRFKAGLFLLMLFVMTVPNQVLFISNYLVLRDLGLLNNMIGVWLVLPFVAAGNVFFMKQFFETLPKELEEAAKIDGATPFQTFWKVILPLATPALGALTILTAQGTWNQYFWALIVLTSPQDNFTLPIGLNSFNRLYGNAGDYGLILAGAIVSAIPVIILFSVFQRYFVASAATSGGKE